MRSITATILTYNEENRIEACLKSLAGVADEIIVVDSYSTDSTVDICRRYGCRVTQRQLRGYGAQRQYATSLATHSYILALDADEVLSPALARSIMDLKKTGFTHRIYALSRLNFYCGRPVRHCGWYPDVQIRLFDKRYANWNLRDVQERVIFRDSVRPSLIDGDILHYRCDSPVEYARTERRHAALKAKVIAASGKRVGICAPMYHGLKEFVKCYFGSRGFSDGLTGLAISRERFTCTRLAWKAAKRINRQK
ncbi:MAG: glycosyltransferase family 2 protein [Muribaculaceae bacterium]|nr:glycosyltransferase family 2 protein [Muribaculaceae bacterium]